LDFLPSLPQGHYQQLGVVLRATISGERAKNLLLLLKEAGLVWATAAGAASGRSRLSGVTEPLVWGYFTLYRSPRRIYVREVAVREDFWPLKQNQEKLRAALEICGDAARFSLPGHPPAELLPILFWTLKALEAGTEPAAVRLRFLYRWGSALGIVPSLERCSACGKPVPQGLLTLQGLLCTACAGPFPAKECLSLGEKELNRLKKAVMLSGKAFRKESFSRDEIPLFGKVSTLLTRLIESSV